MTSFQAKQELIWCCSKSFWCIHFNCSLWMIDDALHSNDPWPTFRETKSIQTLLNCSHAILPALLCDLKPIWVFKCVSKYWPINESNLSIIPLMARTNYRPITGSDRPSLICWKLDVRWSRRRPGKGHWQRLGSDDWRNILSGPQGEIFSNKEQIIIFIAFSYTEHKFDLKWIHEIFYFYLRKHRLYIPLIP